MFATRSSVFNASINLWEQGAELHREIMFEQQNTDVSGINDWLEDAWLTLDDLWERQLLLESILGDGPHDSDELVFLPV